MLLAHRIRLDPTSDQRDYFPRAAGTARRVWNWALAEWMRQTASGQRPNAMLLKKRFNAMKHTAPAWLDANGQPWLRAIHRGAHSQPFANLAKVWNRYFAARREHRPAHPPVFKKKGRCRDSFYVANDKLHLEGMTVVLPKVGHVALREVLHWPGRIMGASVSREEDHWFLSLQVEVPEQAACLHRASEGITGVDLGISAPATLSSAEKVARALARLHACIARVRADFLHKLTTRLCRENQTVVIEDLNVNGMLASARLSRAVADVGFYGFRRQLQYKAKRYGTTLMLADRWYPSSKLCSACGARYGELSLGERIWTCVACGARHDRDVNAAINLQRLATGAFAAQSALPVASPAATPDTLAGMVPAGVGKVTSVRHEYGQQDGSGQEENDAHF